MDRERELKIIRRAYAKQVTAAAGVGDPQVEAAFAAVAREDFLGTGPWRWGGGYRAYAGGVNLAWRLLKSEPTVSSLPSTCL
jgi:hypothetical protein